MMKRMGLLLVLTMVFSTCFAEEVVTTKDGRKVILKDNKTWEYYQEPVTLVSPANGLDQIGERCLSALKAEGTQFVLVKEFTSQPLKYVAADAASYRILSENDPKYAELIRTIDSWSLYKVARVIELKGKSVWENQPILFYVIGQTYEENSKVWKWTVLTGDGTTKMTMKKMNPPLSDNGLDYYISVDDHSNCPLKILAYHMSIDSNVTEVGLELKNTAQKEIIGYTGTFLLYDKLGKPVTWGGGSNVFRFMSQDDTIPVRAALFFDGYWRLTLYEKTRRLKPSIREVFFADGTKWMAK